MAHIPESLDVLEKQDIYSLWKRGMPEDVESQVKLLCIEYRNATPKDRSVVRSIVSRKATWVILQFAVTMATRAMQNKDKESLGFGISALVLSNIVDVDLRDALEPVARLAYAAQQCGLELAEYTTAICPEVSPKLMEWIRKPRPVHVGQDANGNLVFKRTAEAEARRTHWNELIKAHREKRESSKNRSS